MFPTLLVHTHLWYHVMSHVLGIETLISYLTLLVYSTPRVHLVIVLPFTIMYFVVGCFPVFLAILDCTHDLHHPSKRVQTTIKP